VPQEEIRRAATEGRASDERWHVRKDGSRVYCSGVMSPLRTIGGFAKIARDLTAQQNAQDALKSAHAALESRVTERTAALAAEVAVRRQAEERANVLVRQLVTVQEDERRRIARDLHDQLGQQFTALRMQLEAHRRRCPDPGSDLADIAAEAEQIDAAIEFLAWQLRPTVLDDLGLVAALKTFVAEWSKHTGIPASFDVSSLGEARLPPESETHLYRIAQEALHNVAKHSQATSVSVLLGSRADAVFLVVEDDGKGFDPASDAAVAGLGLNGMRERARLCGGSVDIKTSRGKGTTVFATMPLIAASS
jgi:signal transduction histidine kinase